MTEQLDKSAAECVEDGDHVTDSERSRKFTAVVAQSELSPLSKKHHIYFLKIEKKNPLEKKTFKNIICKNRKFSMKIQKTQN